MITIKVWLGGEKWKVIGIYVNNDLERKLEELKKWTEEKGEKEKIIIGGDFIGREGEIIGEEDIEDERESKDKKMNREGRKLCSFLEEQGWSVLNGNYRGDEEREWTYVGERGNLVIDYVIGDNRTRERIVEFRMEDRIDSDHRPITVGIEGEKRRLGGNKGRGRMKRGDWTKKEQEDFKEAFRGVIGYGEGVEEEWEILKKEIRKAFKKVGENEGEEKERG